MIRNALVTKFDSVFPGTSVDTKIRFLLKNNTVSLSVLSYVINDPIRHFRQQLDMYFQNYSNVNNCERLWKKQLVISLEGEDRAQVSKSWEAVRWGLFQKVFCSYASMLIRQSLVKTITDNTLASLTMLKFWLEKNRPWYYCVHCELQHSIKITNTYLQ